MIHALQIYDVRTHSGPQLASCYSSHALYNTYVCPIWARSQPRLTILQTIGEGRGMAPDLPRVFTARSHMHIREWVADGGREVLYNIAHAESHDTDPGELAAFAML
jgi:hypothetical protein